MQCSALLIWVQLYSMRAYSVLLLLVVHPGRQWKHLWIPSVQHKISELAGT